MEYYGTIGTSCAERETLCRMYRAGMTGIRLNLSHGGLAEKRDWLRLIRAAARDAGASTRLLVDLQGPEVRIGVPSHPLQGSRNGRVTGRSGHQQGLYVQGRVKHPLPQGQAPACHQSQRHHPAPKGAGQGQKNDPLAQQTAAASVGRDQHEGT